MRKGTRWTTAVGVVLVGGLLTGCGTKQIGGNGAQGDANTQTGCMNAAGLMLNPRAVDQLDVRRKGVDGVASVYTLPSDTEAKKLGANLGQTGSGTTIGRQVVIYRGQDAKAMQDTVEGCMRRYKEPAAPKA